MTLRSARGDGYARLSSGGTDVFLTPEDGGLLFVDLAFRSEGWDQVAGALRSLPPSLIGESSLLVFRSPTVRWGGALEGVAEDEPSRIVIGGGPGWPTNPVDLADRLADAMGQHRLPRRSVGAFELPVAARPVVSPGVDDVALAHCRAVELDAFLRRNGAIWEPTTYHYQLPSGRHAASFVRIADALRDPAAPAALASWLQGALTDATALVVDSGTLMPLAHQLDLVVRRASLTLPVGFGGLVGIESMDGYPLSRFEFLRRFDRFEAVDVLAVLSVGSSGRTYRLLGQSLADTASSWRAECLVARGRHQAQALSNPADREKQDPWLAIDALKPDIDPTHGCRWCRDAERAPLVHIDPRTFATMALPSPTLVMPDTFAASRNASLFDGYLASPSPAVQLAQTERSRLRAKPYLRPEQPRRVRFEPTAHLFEETTLAVRIQERLDELKALRSTDPSKDYIERALGKVQGGKPTIAVCDQEELRVLATELLSQMQQGQPDEGSRATDAAQIDARRRFLALAQQVCSTVREVVSDADEDLGERLGRHSSVLLTAAGLQTGVTLQHLVVRVQDEFAAIGADPSIHGLVVHAHPIDGAAWASVRNSFGGRRNPSLIALWLTYLPVESPFAEELDLLRTVQDRWLDSARATTKDLWRRRMAWLQADGAGRPTPPPPSPLWSPTAVRLRRTSIYGSLDDRHAVPAVGAAMHESLDEHSSGGAPEWVRFDLPNVLRSYFDGLLHASVIRWVTPQRAWWGSPNQSRALIEELQGRFADSADWQLLLPELLLASAQGKVPAEAVEVLLAEAKSRLRSSDAERWPEDVLDFVELGSVLVERLWKVPEVE